MTRTEIEMLAVALGQELAAVRARLNAAFGAVAGEPAGGYTKLVYPDGGELEIAIAADGRQTVVRDDRKGDAKGKPL